MSLGEGCAGLWRRSPIFGRAAAYLASALVAGTFLYHLAHHSTAYLGLLEDDYFYYVTVADKLVRLGKLTYDGTTLTNGFHPLWFGLIVLIRLLAGGLGPPFYVILSLVFLASMVACYELGRRFAGRLGASPRLAAALAALYAVGTARLVATGMECALAVPLFLWWLIEIARPAAPLTPRRAAWLGFIASLAILARLDIAIAVALGLAGYVVLARPPFHRLWRLLTAFGAGGVLVPLYAAANIVYFGTPLPVSALAKRLIVTPGFSLAYARAVAFGTYFGPTIGVVLPLGMIALFLIVRRDRSLRPEARLSGAIALSFAFLFYFLNALSGWIYFGWYAYPLPAASLAALVFICECWRPRQALRSPAILAVTACVAFVPVDAALYYWRHGPRWTVADNTLLATSDELARRLESRDGLFAMGAVAGVAAYVVDKPVLQLEGIITDRRLVEHVRRQDPLQDVLREYHADYLIEMFVGIAPRRSDGCYLVTQPDAEWAGKRTAKMRGEICSEPVVRFYTPPGNHAWSIFPGVETLVWDLRRAEWKPAPRVARSM